MLKSCASFWGDVRIESAFPSIEQHHNVLFIPFSQEVYFDSDKTWGIYDDDGGLIDAAALRRGAGQGLIGQSDQRDRNFSHIQQSPDHEYIYGGPILNHYGHFICSTLSRLWWLTKEEIGDRKILFHGHDTLSHLMTMDFIATCFNRLGLSPDNAEVVLAPTRLRKLAIPRVAFQEQDFAHLIYKDLCHLIGKQYWQPPPAHTRPIYISKTRLTAGVGRVANEIVIERTLAESGVEIIYPEELAFAKQVQLFSQNRTVITFPGSALHTSIFSPPCKRILCVAPGGLVNSNMALIDRVNQNVTTYLNPTCGFTSESNVDGFLNSITLNNAREVADDLLELIAAEL